ncbi:MAG: zinc dependent phospholipase C family protein [Bacteroidia bacterium]
MKSKRFKISNWINISFIIALAPMLISWGTFGHEHINRAAVLALPSPLQNFFYNHIDFITQESTVPDLRKYTLKDRSENPRHFIDLENFGSMDSMPANLAEVKKKYDDKFLQDNGILPWYIMDMMDKLTKAFKEKRKTEILFLAGDLGHYIGDAYMPLHTTVNHDGQATNQKGIHSFWESQLPELFGDNYNFNVGEAKYIDNVQSETWKIISSSHSLMDQLFTTESDLLKSYPKDKVYLKDKNDSIVKTKFGQQIHSVEYAKAYHDKLNGMVEKQMRGAIESTSSFWFTAWVNAGKPDLLDLDPADQTERNKANLKRELDLLKKGKLTDVKSEKEY